jgi:riboflavin synthase
LQKGSKVNLERPVKVGGRLDGHIVTGHIDGQVQIAKITKFKNSVLFEFKVPAALTKFIVEKGSVALDGISLTVVKIVGTKLTVGIIPHTIQITNLRMRKVGDSVNLEVDILAKHAAKLLKK